jgi:hypothetical protein
MDNVTFFDSEMIDGIRTFAIIEHADGSFTSMLKAEYDRRQAEQSTPSVTNGD